MLHTTFLERRRLEAARRAAVWSSINCGRLNALLQAISAAKPVLCGKTRRARRSRPAGRRGRAARLARRVGRCPSRSKKNCSRADRRGAVGRQPDVSAATSTSGFIRPRARAAGRWRCSTRPRIGSGGSNAGNMCSTPPAFSRDDCCLMAFSFGPFIGFWSAFDAAACRGCLVVPGGGMNTLARLELLRTGQATVVFCTPSYALHMAEVGARASDRRRLSWACRSWCWPASRGARSARPRPDRTALERQGVRSWRGDRSRAPGAMAMPRTRACTCWKASSSPSSSRSKPARRPPKANCPNWC